MPLRRTEQSISPWGHLHQFASAPDGGPGSAWNVHVPPSPYLQRADRKPTCRHRAGLDLAKLRLSAQRRLIYLLDPTKLGGAPTLNSQCGKVGATPTLAKRSAPQLGAAPTY